MRIARLRLLIGCLIAPFIMVAPWCFQAARHGPYRLPDEPVNSVPRGWRPPTYGENLFHVFRLVLPRVYLISAVVGFPLFKLSFKLRWARIWYYLIVGAITGAIMTIYLCYTTPRFFDPNEIDRIFDLSLLIPDFDKLAHVFVWLVSTALPGASAGVVFWGIAVQGYQAKTRKNEIPQKT